jgi:hypothetical protein
VVEVEVVLAEVGEQRDVVDDPVDPVLGQGVAGDLHDAGAQAALRHHREDAVQHGGLGSRAHAVEPLVADAGLDRADETGGCSQGREGGVHEVGRGRLAVGAR